MAPGIGFAIAEKLASQGCHLILNYHRGDATVNERFARLASTHAVQVLGVAADISTPEGARSVVTQGQAFFSSTSTPFQIAILVNNAGIALNAPLADVTVPDFERTYRVNVLGPLLVTQAAAPFLPHDRSGRVVNVSSVSSAAGFVTQTVYGGSKAALEAMTRTWARELAARATVNAVNPGPVEGPMYRANQPAFMRGIAGWIAHTPGMEAREGADPPAWVDEAREFGGRLLRTREIADLVALLCSRDSGLVTGQVVCANGGMFFQH